MQKALLFALLVSIGGAAETMLLFDAPLVSAGFAFCACLLWGLVLTDSICRGE